MKRCPQCQRSYADETLNFCLDDGQWLHDVGADEPATAILSESRPLGTPTVGQTFDDASTRPQIHATATEAEPRSHVGEPSERRGLSAHRAAKPLVGVALAALILVGGIFAYRYFGSANSKQNESSAIASIAVLPFQNRNSDPDTEYLSDGLAESLIFRLSQLPRLKVSPTTSVIRYKGNDLDMKKIAADLGVDTVMTGRLIKRGDNLNITVELIDVRNNTSLWGEQYVRKMSDLLATQREIAATITQKLQLKLAGNETGITKKYTDNNEAYQLYLNGRYHFAKRTRQDLFKSIEIFEQAVKLDPSFALGYVGIAEAWAVIPSFPYASPAECIPKAKAAAQKALDLDPDLPEAHTVTAMIAATYDWDWATAEREFKRALEIDPDLALTHYRYAWTYLSPLGRHDQAIAEMRKAMELEPLSLIQGANYAGILLYARRYDEAIAQGQKTFDLDPRFFGSQSWLSHSYSAAGKYADALILAEPSLNSESPFISDAIIAYAKSGQQDKALALIDRWKEAEKQKYVMNYWFAMSYAALGDKDAAFAELERAYRNHDWFLQRIKVDPFADPLRDDPRFDEMVKKLKFPE
jgi:TolB-like protein